MDAIAQAQNLLGEPRNQTWDRRVDASVISSNIALYGDAEIGVTEFVRLNVGLRAVLLLFDIDERLGNFAPSSRPADSFIMGFRRSAGGVTVGPRASAEVRPIEELSFRAAYGQGYRSPQARTLGDGETAPFTTVESADIGAELRLDRTLRVTVAGYWTELSDDVAFEPREGRLERIGASRRLGAVAYFQARPVDWLRGSFSLTYVDAELLQPPPATADDPQPAFAPGQNLPYVPPVIIRAELGVNGTLVPGLGPFPLRGSLGVGYSFLSERPLPFGGFADPVHLADINGRLRWGPVIVGLTFYNLFDSRYAASEFVFASNWERSAIPTRVPARHIAAGAPLTVMATLGIAP